LEDSFQECHLVSLLDLKPCRDERYRAVLKTKFAGSDLTPARSYTDQKGHPPYDYPSGTIAYDLSGKVQAGEPVAIMITNTDSNQDVAISGGVLVVTYVSESNPVKYWIAKGADMIYTTEGVTDQGD